MIEPIKKIKKKPESYSPKDKPEILYPAQDLQNENSEVSDIFTRKNIVELIAIKNEIKVAGLSFKKCKQTGSVKLGSPMELYAGDKIALQEKIKNVKYPQIAYAIWLNTEQDMIFGKEVIGFTKQDDLFGSFTIPAGKYMKVSWNAETFSELVSDAMQKSWERAGVKTFLENNGLIADHTLDIEVYPHETMCVGCENGPEWAFSIKDVYTPSTMYTVKEK